MLAIKQQAGGGSFDPLSITWHGVYWAEAPTWTNPGDGNAVSQWDDVSGNGAHFTQATAGSRPTYRSSVAALNGKPALEFDGSADTMASTHTTVAQTVTWVFVARNTGTSQGAYFDADGDFRQILSKLNATQYRMFANSVVDVGGADAGAHLLIVQMSGSTSSLAEDGVTLTGTVDPGTAGVPHTRIGSSFGSSNFMAGEMAFVGRKSGTLTTQERSDLLAWSQSHYGTP